MNRLAIERIVVLVSASFALIPGSVAAASETLAAKHEYNFRVGVGRVEVTPTENPLPQLMGGAFPLPAESVDLPLFVKAIVIAAGDQKVALVTLDVLKYPSVEADRAAREIEKQTGIPSGHVTISSSHTHSGPLYDYFEDRLVRSIVKATTQANAKLTPGRIAFTQTQVTGVSHNRRLLIDGEAWNSWLVQPPERRTSLPAAGPLDTTLMALAVMGQDGRYQAILWNYGSHPNANRAHAISPDYPGYFQRYVNERLGYDTMTLYLPGAAGDVNPKPGSTPDGIGRELAYKLVESLKTLEFIGDASLRVERRTLKIPDREDPYFAEREIAKKWPAKLESFREMYASTRARAPASHVAHITGIRIGEKFAMITNPSELFVDVALEIERRSPIEYTMIVQQTNGALGYLPGVKDFALKGYEVWYGEHSNLSKNAAAMLEESSVEILGNLALPPTDSAASAR